MAMVVRTAGSDPLNLLPAIRREVARLDPNLPLYRVATLEQVMANSLERTRFSTTLLGAFALLALLLAALGIYGAVSHTVGQRTREIGIRMALGARSTDALRLVLRQCMVPVLGGMAAGLAVSPVVTRVLSTELYGVSSSDPLTLVAVSCFLVAAAAAAVYFPARRAASVDPMVALRYE
jgi:putative ABC transport system permease protein